MDDNIVNFKPHNIWRKWILRLLFFVVVGLHGLSVYTHSVVRGNFSGITFAYSVPVIKTSTNVYFFRLGYHGLVANRLNLSSWKLSDDGQYLFRYLRFTENSPYYLQKVDLSTGQEFCHAYQDDEKPNDCTNEVVSPATETVLESQR